MCDCIFNAAIPSSTPTKIVIRPSAATFVTGLAKAYDETYPEQLRPYLSQREFSQMMEAINDALLTYFPCCLCWTIGYLCCLPTLGLSLCCPAICISDAEQSLRDMIAGFNRKKLKSKNLEMSLKFGFSTSWLEIALPIEAP